ncbi:MAG: thioredoxin domain-containing protein, partial [Methyloceanibacter sp.]
EQFDKCLADQDLFKKIVETRTIANDKFQVDSTPTFFVNGKRLKGDHQIETFQVEFGETPAKKETDGAETDNAETDGAETDGSPPAQ